MSLFSKIDVLFWRPSVIRRAVLVNKLADLVDRKTFFALCGCAIYCDDLSCPSTRTLLVYEATESSRHNLLPTMCVCVCVCVCACVRSCVRVFLLADLSCSHTEKVWFAANCVQCACNTCKTAVYSVLLSLTAHKLNTNCCR